MRADEAGCRVVASASGPIAIKIGTLGATRKALLKVSMPCLAANLSSSTTAPAPALPNRSIPLESSGRLHASDGGREIR
jgi:hypothetical protein